MHVQSIDQELAATFETIKKQRPVYSELVDTFQDLFQVQASLAARFADHEYEFQDPGLERSGQGVSYLADAALPECGEQLETAGKEILPVLERSFPFTDQIKSLSEQLDAGNLDLNALVRAYLEGDQDAFEQAARDTSISAPVLSFAVRCILAPVLAGMARAMAPRLKALSWTQGYCPFCGFPPSVGSLSKFNNDRDEALVGGGGKKRLTCSLCSHEWGFRRDSCPACGNSDQNQRELLYAEDTRHERIEACKKCGSYLLCVDLREVEGNPRMEALPLGLVHLDLIAQEKDYSPLAAMPWNAAE